MRSDIRAIGPTFLLALAIVLAVSVSGRLYREQRDERLAQERMVEAERVAER